MVVYLFSLVLLVVDLVVNLLLNLFVDPAGHWPGSGQKMSTQAERLLVTCMDFLQFVKSKHFSNLLLRDCLEVIPLHIQFNNRSFKLFSANRSGRSDLESVFIIL